MIPNIINFTFIHALLFLFNFRSASLLLVLHFVFGKKQDFIIHIEGFLLSLFQVLFLRMPSRAEFISKSAQIIDNYFSPMLLSAAMTIRTPKTKPMIVPTMNPNTAII